METSETSFIILFVRRLEFLNCVSFRVLVCSTSGRHLSSALRLDRTMLILSVLFRLCQEERCIGKQADGSRRKVYIEWYVVSLFSPQDSIVLYALPKLYIFISYNKLDSVSKYFNNVQSFCYCCSSKRIDLPCHIIWLYN